MLWLFAAAALVMLPLSLLVCGSIGLGISAAPDPVAALTRLPTLTRTPLPTLTPTTMTIAIAESIDTTSPAGPAAEVVTATTPIPGPILSSGSMAEAPGESAASTDSSTTSPTSPPLPTATPIHTDTPAPPPTATPTETPAPTSTLAATPTATPILESSGWSFASVQDYPNQEEQSLLLYGDIINNTGSPQILTSIDGTFYDPQGQIIAGSAFDYWPAEVIPPGEHIPFELTVYDIQSVANFDLSVGAEPSNQTLRQDFEFFDISQWNDEEGSYCLTGKLQNLGGALQEYLVIIATFYDGQANVVNFGNYYEPYAVEVVGDQTLDFELCTDVRSQEIANYDLQSWGL